MKIVKLKEDIAQEDDGQVWEYQGKSRKQVRGSARIFVACIFGLLLALLIALISWICR